MREKDLKRGIDSLPRHRKTEWPTAAQTGKRVFWLQQKLDRKSSWRRTALPSRAVKTDRTETGASGRSSTTYGAKWKNQWHRELPGHREQETEEARPKGKIKQLTQKAK
jgi:hypothetical protein